MRKRLTDDQIRKIHELWKSGLGSVLISRELDIPLTTVDRVVYRRSVRSIELLGPYHNRTPLYDHITTNKLSPDDVREMRRMRADGVMVKDIAEMFSVTHSTAGYAISGRTWKHVR